LRFSLDSNCEGLVPLSRELKIVTDYLEIERARFGARLRYSIDAPEELAEIEVPPMSVQTLVENAVKHAIAPRREGGEVVIRASGIAEGLELIVADDGPGFTADAIVEGHGLDNLRSRLAVLFGDTSGLRIERRGERTAVILRVPQRVRSPQ
ncbi:MAG: sensor histidine kinase, partial [Bryobacteraceae bacterium]